MQRFLLLVLALFVTSTVRANEVGWELSVEAPDLKIYRKPSAGGSDLVAFRVIGYLNATPLEVTTAILDRESRMSWMRDIKILRTVRLPAPGSVIEYTEVKTPFILKNRDFVIRTDVEVDLQKQIFTVVSKSVIDSEVPETSKVRSELVEGRFTIAPGPLPGTSQLTADMDVDPKGSIPNWIVNHFQKNWPMGMFRGLGHFLQKKVAKMPADLVPLFTSAALPVPEPEPVRGAGNTKEKPGTLPRNRIRKE